MRQPWKLPRENHPVSNVNKDFQISSGNRDRLLVAVNTTMDLSENATAAGMKIHLFRKIYLAKANV